jgi:4-hydroxy-tetrahydrodipicolinate reductase
MTYPAGTSPQLADTLHRLAVADGVAVLGTGINPGTGVCAHIESITATREKDLSPYGPTVPKSQGVGLTPKAFQRGLEDGTVVGHVGFPQSLHMIADAMGWHLGRIDEKRAPIIAEGQRATPRNLPASSSQICERDRRETAKTDTHSLGTQSAGTSPRSRL